MKAGRFVHIAMLMILAAWLGSHFIMNSQSTKRKLADSVTSILESVLETEVDAQGVSLVRPCGISVEGLVIYDLAGDTLLSCSSATARLKLLPLILEKKFLISSIRLVRPDLRVAQASKESPANIQFLLDLTKSGKKTELPDIRINSILVGNGKVSYDIADQPQTEGILNPAHLNFSKINTNISLKSLKKDSINLIIRKFNMQEQSGLELQQFRCRLTASQDDISVNRLHMTMPGSRIDAPEILAGRSLSSTAPFTDTDYSIHVRRSFITPSDLSALIPEAKGFTDPVYLHLIAQGTPSGILRIDSTTVSIPEAGLELNGHGWAHGITEIKQASVRDLSLNVQFKDSTYSYLARHAGPIGITIPDVLKRLGHGQADVKASGSLRRFTADAKADCSAGKLIARMTSDSGNYVISTDATGLDAGRLSGNPLLGKADFTVNTNFTKTDSTVACGVFSAVLASLEANGYTYQDLKANGTYNQETVTFNARLDDPQARLDVAAVSTPDLKNPDYTLKIKADSINLAALGLIRTDSISVLSADVTAHLTGLAIDDIRGEADIYGISYDNSNGNFTCNSIEILSKDIMSQRALTVESELLSASVIGDYNLTSLHRSLLGTIKQPLPSLYEWILHRTGISGHPSVITDDEFMADIRLQQTDLFSKVFSMPLQMDGPVDIHCFVSNPASTSDMDIKVSDVTFKGNRLQKGTITMNQNGNRMNTNIKGIHNRPGETPTNAQLALNTTDGSADIAFNWNKPEKGSFEGTLLATVGFGRYDHKAGIMRTTIDIDTTQIILNNVDWNLSPSQIVADSNLVRISNLNITHRKQFIKVNGVVSADSTDLVSVSIQDIDLEQLTTMLHKTKMGLKGIASGSVYAYSVLGQPAIYGHMNAEKFCFLGSYGGDVNLNAIWDEETGNMDIEATMTDNISSHTEFAGIFNLQNDSIDFDITAHRTDMTFMNAFLSKVFKRVDGYADGNIRMFGKLQSLDMEGMAILEDTHLYHEFLNTTYEIKRDTLWFEPGRMNFTNLEFYDENGHDGILTCLMTHRNFRNWDVDLNVDVANMQVLNFQESANSLVYGKAIIEGSAYLHATPDKRVYIQSDCRTAPGTSIVANLGSNNVSSYNFLTFADASDQNQEKDIDTKTNLGTTRSQTSKLTIDINLECSDDAAIMMRMNSFTGAFRGNGNISVRYNNLDGVTLNGLYNLNYGLATLSLQDVIRKEFNLLEDSYIRFSGSLNDTQLNLHTYHTVNSASMYDLAADISGNGNVRVRCLLDILGTINNPELKFDIDMPQGSAEYKDMLASATSTEEQRNMQFMYLLAVGKFYTYDYSNQAALAGMSPNAMESFVSSTVNGQINNLLSQVFDSNIFSLSSNVTAGSYLSNNAASIANKELEGILEARLLNNRLLFNGNFGYRENGVKNTSNFVGDFELQYLLFPKQGISLKGYNKTNDRYFTKTTLTTQGVGLIFEKDFDSLFRK